MHGQCSLQHTAVQEFKRVVFPLGEATPLALTLAGIQGSGVDLRCPLPPARGCPPLLGTMRCMRALP